MKIQSIVHGSEIKINRAWIFNNETTLIYLFMFKVDFEFTNDLKSNQNRQCRPTNGRQCWPTNGRQCRPTNGRQCRPTNGRSIARIEATVY